MTPMNRSCQLLLGAAAFVVMSTTGCNLPVSKLAPKLPSLDHFSTGAHGVACCANGDCTSSRLAPMGQPLPGLSPYGNGQYAPAGMYGDPHQYPAGIQPASEQESRSIYSLFTADRAANQKRGLFSCGANSQQPMQIRSQNQASEPRQFPAGDSSGVARVTAQHSNLASPFRTSPVQYGVPAFGLPSGQIQQTSAVHFSYAEPRLPVSETGHTIYEAD